MAKLNFPKYELETLYANTSEKRIESVHTYVKIVDPSELRTPPIGKKRSGLY